jgi:hypothetical protein
MTDTIWLQYTLNVGSNAMLECWDG